jgi:hypothetical protein
MSEAWIRTYEHGSDYSESLGGVMFGDGPHDPPPWWHRCAPQTRGRVDRELVERCRCGATRFDGYGPWVNRNQTRKARRKKKAEAKLPRVQVTCRVCGKPYEAAAGTAIARQELCTDCWSEQFIREYGPR